MYGNTNHNSGSPQRQIDQLWMQLCTVSWRLSCQSQKRNRPITKCRIKNTGIRNHSASKIICTHAENCRKSSLAVFRYALPELYLDYNRVMRKFRICVIDDSEFDRLRFTTLLKQVDYPVAIYSFSCVRDFLDSREKSDIVFLDIELKEEDGIGLRNSVRNNTRWIIYMTSWKERMQEAFSSNVIAFLLKQDPDIALRNDQTVV